MSAAETPERLAWTVEEGAARVGMGRTAFYGLVMSGEIPSFTVGRRRLIPETGLREWVASKTEQGL